MKRWHRPAATLVALGPPAGCAWFVDGIGRWDLFERTGTITAAVGLALASRRYLQHGIAELASLQADNPPNLNAEEDIHTTKLGLALSAFGMVISGWGRYLGWWSFLFVAFWAFMAYRDARRDHLYIRSRFPKAATEAEPRSHLSERCLEENKLR
jgi:hypothetical protein